MITSKHLKAPPQELRVFVSSTFHDLQEEREYLAKRVLPRLRGLCRDRGIDLTEIDFRWGITEEESSLGRTIRSCLEEVDRCRPFFIGILGDRFGWIPSLREVQKDSILLNQFPWVEEAVIAGSSIRDLEFSYAALQHPEAAEGAFFYLRAGNTCAVEAEREKLEQTRESIKNSGCAYREFSSPAEFGEQVRSDFEELIKRLWPLTESPTAMQAERITHEAFAVAKRRAYISNANYLGALTKHVQSTDSPLVVWGDSGAGKSSLIAYFTNYYKRQHPGTFTISHFIGASTSGGKAEGILRHIMEEIKERTQAQEEIPSDAEALVRDFPIWLARTQGEKIILAIDALNQLERESLNLEWLPNFFPPNVRVIVTTTEGETLSRLREREWAERHITDIDLEDREALTVRYLGEYHKGLNREQLKRVTRNDKCASPIFLKTLLEELRLFGTFEDLDHRIDEYLAVENTDQLFQKVLERMERDYGENLVRNTLSLIWASRNGLSEKELGGIMQVKAENLSILLSSLEYHLTSSNGLRMFFHEFLRRAVEKRYTLDEHSVEFHRTIGDFFSRQPPTQRRATEELWHWKGIGNSNRFVLSIRDSEFLIMLLRKDNIYNLVELATSLNVVSEVMKATRDLLKEYGMQQKENVQYSLLVSMVGKLWLLFGKYESAANLLADFLRSSSQDNPADIFPLVQDCATAYYELHKIDEAEKLLCSMLNTLLGLSSKVVQSNLMECYTSLGAIYIAKGEFPKAEESLNSALQIGANLFDSNDSRTIEAMNNLGALYIRTEEYQKAEYRLEECYRNALKAFGTKHPQTISALENLGILNRRQNRFEEALKFYSMSLEAKILLYGTIHPATARALNNIGSLHLSVGNPEQAIVFLKQALEIREKVLGQDHRDSVFGMVALAIAFFENSEYPNSRNLFVKALKNANEGLKCEIKTSYSRYFQRLEELGEPSLLTI